VKLLANENIARDVIERLRAEGHDVLWVRESFAGATDDDVLARASSEGRLLITFDKDFGSLVFSKGQSASNGVILFRIEMPSPAVAASKVAAAIKSRNDWTGYFSVVDETKIRMVKLPQRGRTKNTEDEQVIRTAVTVSLVPQARQGPFVYHGDLAGSIAAAARLGFDAVEIFPPGAEAIDVAAVKRMTGDAGLKVAAVGTGAGFVVHKLTLIDADASVRAKGIEFVRRIIDVAGALGAPAIIGSMQGRHGEGERDAAMGRLAESLAVLGAHAKQYAVPLLYEPLNRYETNVFNRQGEAAEWLRGRGIQNLKILCDLFHMNIEEADVAGALRAVGELLGHVHFVDSNRLAAGMGHVDFAPIVKTLHDSHYAGYVSAECFPIPDADAAARKSIDTYQRLFKN
jgi:sugar phosphate isomerase/epimerase/predicted nuclease of predicted toxin-antitoxin system